MPHLKAKKIRNMPIILPDIGIWNTFTINSPKTKKEKIYKSDLNITEI